MTKTLFGFIYLFFSLNVFSIEHETLIILPANYDYSYHYKKDVKRNVNLGTTALRDHITSNKGMTASFYPPKREFDETYTITNLSFMLTGHELFSGARFSWVIKFDLNDKPQTLSGSKVVYNSSFFGDKVKGNDNFMANKIIDTILLQEEEE